MNGPKHDGVRAALKKCILLKLFPNNLSSSHIITLRAEKSYDLKLGPFELQEASDRTIVRQ